MLVRHTEFTPAMKRDLPKRFAPVEGQLYHRYVKRIGDVVLSVLLIVLAAPILVPLLTILLGWVALDGHSPIYRQKRIGRGGRVYSMVKIRTMVADADTRLAAYLEANPMARAEWEMHQKLRHDPRITRVGRVLRKSSLDELPQLWNVILGDMSLVGPRPILVAQADQYPGRCYAAMRPGITGLWQVTARHHSSFAERAEIDDRYHQTLSLGTDLKILFRTIGAVMNGTGC